MFNLKFIDTQNILQHESLEKDRYEKLRLNILEDGIQKNPVIVTQIDRKKFLILDGAHRFSVLKSIGCTQIFCQIVEESEIIVKGWIHAIELKDSYFFSNQYISNSQNENNISVTINNVNTNYYFGDFLNNKKDLEIFKKFVSNICSKPSFKRANALNSELVNIKYPDLSLKQIKNLVLSGKVLPAGVTKFTILSGRVLHANISLSYLKSNKKIMTS